MTWNQVLEILKIVGPALAVGIPFLITVIRVVKTSIRERNWNGLCDFIMNVCSEIANFSSMTIDEKIAYVKAKINIAQPKGIRKIAESDVDAQIKKCIGMSDDAAVVVEQVLDAINESIAQAEKHDRFSGPEKFDYVCADITLHHKHIVELLGEEFISALIKKQIDLTNQVNTHKDNNVNLPAA